MSKFDSQIPTIEYPLLIIRPVILPDTTQSLIAWESTNSPSMGCDNSVGSFLARCSFGKNYFCQLILLFSLFLLLFMSSTALFGTIHESHCTI